MLKRFPNAFSIDEVTLSILSVIKGRAIDKGAGEHSYWFETA